MKKKNAPAKQKKAKSLQDGDVPGTFSGQNLGHNTKKESLGPNTYR